MAPEKPVDETSSIFGLPAGIRYLERNKKWAPRLPLYFSPSPFLTFLTRFALFLFSVEHLAGARTGGLASAVADSFQNEGKAELVESDALQGSIRMRSDANLIPRRKICGRLVFCKRL